MIDPLTTLEQMMNNPESWDFSGARELYAGVDLGTCKSKVIVVDEQGRPRAAAMRRSEGIGSGLILDYFGTLTLLRGMMEEIRSRCPLPIERGATSFPPQTESGNIHTTRYILQGAGLEVLRVLDEPSAANRFLNLQDGAIVDIGGGTTGIALIRGGRIVRTWDEATGGVHLSLVLSGHLRVSFEEAEAIKTDRARRSEILPIVRPVIDKISSIVESALQGWPSVKTVGLVGGTCALEGLTELVAANLGLEVFRPRSPQVITPYGIALSCLEGEDLDLPFSQAANG
jgi:ethanolamine utilization protein EutJ